MTNSGFQQQVAFANETAYGSQATVDQAVGLIQSVNPTETNNLIKIRTMGGSRDYNNIVPGKFEVSGSMDYYLQGGAFLRMAFGEDSATSATPDSGPRTHATTASSTAYVHVMGSAATLQADCFPSFTLEFADDEGSACLVGASAGDYNLNRTYTGCRVNSLSISASVDEPVMVTADWIAQGVIVSSAGATSITQDTKDPYVFYQGAVYSTSGAIAYDTAIESASQLAEVNTLDFSINNNLEAIWYISGTTSVTQTKRGLKALIVKGREYEANLNLNFKDKTMYQRFLGASGATGPQDTLGEYTIVLDFVRNGVIGATPAVTDDYMRIVLSGCKFNDTNIAGAPEDIVQQSLGVFVESAKTYIVDNDSTYTG